MQRIYLDYAAGAPLIPEVKQKIIDYAHQSLVGNPSSLHAEGRQKQALLDDVHTVIAALFGLQPTEVILTSGATESNATVIKGILSAWRANHPGKQPHIVISAIEHPSWRSTAQHESVDITVVPVGENGVVNPEDMLNAIKAETALVGCMYVNNEIGTVQPVAEIGKGIESWRARHVAQWPIFHIDAVQAFPYLNTHMGHVHADTITISGHKYGALEGIGALLVKKGVPLGSQLRGGGQEWGYRAGTENVLGAITLKEALLWNDAKRETLKRHAVLLQKELEQGITQLLPSVAILGQDSKRAPHITYLWLPEVIDEHVVHQLDLKGFAVSSGSACSSGAMLPSSTLLALGFSEEEAFGGIRISYGYGTTKEEIQAFVHLFAGIIKA